jgi:small subunit ribosomal protein S5
LAAIKSSEMELYNKLVYVGRTAKVVKGGRRFNFSALVVVGDKQGHVGYGLGKASEVVDAVSKATDAAKKNITSVIIQNGTIPHEVVAKFRAAKVMLKPASPGTGVIAAGAIRAVLEMAGVENVLTKSLGSANPHNTLKATVKALASVEDAASVAARRKIPIEKVIKG